MIPTVARIAKGATRVAKTAHKVKQHHDNKRKKRELAEDEDIFDREIEIYDGLDWTGVDAVFNNHIFFLIYVVIARGLNIFSLSWWI